MRNFLLTAVLFLTASIASAAVVYDTDLNSDGTTDYYDAELNRKQTIDVYLHRSGNESWFITYSVSFDNSGESVELNNGKNTILKPVGSTKLFVVAQGSAGNGVNFENVFNNKYKYVLVTSDCNEVQDFGGGYKYTFEYGGNNNIVFRNESGTIKDVVHFGSPLPTPVITLLIALGFGAAFVMYRNRKQVKA